MESELRPSMKMDIRLQIEIETRHRDEIIVLKRGLRIANAALRCIRDGISEPSLLASEAVDAIARVSQINGHDHGETSPSTAVAMPD